MTVPPELLAELGCFRGVASACGASQIVTPLQAPNGSALLAATSRLVIGTATVLAAAGEMETFR